MPEIGEITKGTDIGYKSLGCKYVWDACGKCGKQRWVRLLKGRPDSIACLSCNGNRHGIINPMWKGGRIYDHGYVGIRLQPGNFFFPMARPNNYVPEHRLVMAKHLGRNLHSWEIVHHLNGIKDDNRIENLQLILTDKHSQITILERRVKYLEDRVLMLEVENITLRSESWEKPNAIFG